jgi:hypothetical protein
MKVIRAFAKKNNIEMVIIDLGPNVGAWNKTMIMYADYFYSPYFPDYLSMKGLEGFLDRSTKDWKSVFEQNLGMKTFPKFLGSFPQRAVSRGIQKGSEPRKTTMIQACKEWTQRIQEMTTKRLTALRSSGMLLESFRLYRGPGVPELFSLAKDVQTSGYPVTDCAHKHRHLQGDGSSRAINASERARKEGVTLAMKKIVAFLVMNMSSEHQRMLGEAFMRQIGLASTLSDGLETNQPSPAIRRSRPTAATFYYANNQIEHLLNHYIPTAAETSVLTPMQGDDLFTSGGQLKQNISDRLDQFAQNSINAGRLYCPLNLSQNHWVMLVIDFDFTDQADKKMGFKYCDPLSNDIPSALFRTIKKMTDDTGSTMHYEEYQGQLQHDGHNCGPWIIEYSRCVANEAGYVFPPADINQARSNHLTILHQANVRYPGDPHSVAKRKSKRSKSNSKQGGAAQKDSRLFSGKRGHDSNSEANGTRSTRRKTTASTSTTDIQTQRSPSEDGHQSRSYSPSC